MIANRRPIPRSERIVVQDRRNLLAMTTLLFILRSLTRVAFALILLVAVFFALTVIQMETLHRVGPWTGLASFGVMVLALPSIARLKLNFLRSRARDSVLSSPALLDQDLEPPLLGDRM